MTRYIGKDPDDFPVSEELVRDIICRECGSEMAYNEVERDWKMVRRCCECGSDKLDEKPLRATLVDIARTIGGL